MYVDEIINFYVPQNLLEKIKCNKYSLISVFSVKKYSQKVKLEGILTLKIFIRENIFDK